MPFFCRLSPGPVPPAARSLMLLHPRHTAPPTRCTPNMHTADPEAIPLPGQPLLMRTFQLPGKGRVRLTLLPPPSNRGDLMAVVDIGRAAEVRGGGAWGGMFPSLSGVWGIKSVGLGYELSPASRAVGRKPWKKGSRYQPRLPPSFSLSHWLDSPLRAINPPPISLPSLPPPHLTTSRSYSWQSPGPSWTRPSTPMERQQWPYCARWACLPSWWRSRVAAVQWEVQRPRRA